MTGVAATPDNKYIVTARVGDNNYADLWDRETGELVRTFTGHHGDVTSVAVTPDNKYIVTGSRDNTAKLWDSQTGAVVWTYRGHTDEVVSVAATTDNKYIVTGSKDHSAKLWSRKSGKVVRTFHFKNLKFDSSGVTSVVATPDNKYIVAGTTDKGATLWDRRTGKAVRTFTRTSWDEVLSVAVTPDSKYVVIGSEGRTANFGGDRNIRLWSIGEDGTCKCDGGWIGENCLMSVASIVGGVLGSLAAAVMAFLVTTRCIQPILTQRNLDREFAQANPLIIKTVAGDTYTLTNWGIVENLHTALVKQHPELGGGGDGDGAHSFELRSQSDNTVIRPEHGDSSRQQLFSGEVGCDELVLTFTMPVEPRTSLV
jgi:WD40 repeat protein